MVDWWHIAGSLVLGFTNSTNVCCHWSMEWWIFQLEVFASGSKWWRPQISCGTLKSCLRCPGCHCYEVEMRGWVWQKMKALIWYVRLLCTKRNKQIEFLVHRCIPYHFDPYQKTIFRKPKNILSVKRKEFIGWKSTPQELGWNSLLWQCALDCVLTSCDHPVVQNQKEALVHHLALWILASYQRYRHHLSSLAAPQRVWAWELFFHILLPF